VEYDPTQFRGTAPFYLAGRPPYSAELPAVLADELHLDGRGRLLDVGCGPGTVGVQLAGLFDHVTFVEPDADLLAEARAHAAGLAAADFLQTTAEELADLGLSPMRVVTFGQSFHRTDRVPTAEAVYDLLEPGGSMVLVVHDSKRPAPPQPVDTAPIPDEEIRRLVRSYLGDELRSGARLASSYSSEPFEQTLARTRFGRSRTVYATGRADLVRDADGIIANYLSMSFAAPHLLGARLPEFVDEVRALLARCSPSGRFWDWPGDTAMIIATRD
jgi:SAM-dependent methyltransferase